MASLAERMRPKSLTDYVGQDHIVGPKGALRPALEARRLPSLLFWGPPGVGKTSLAQLLAQHVDLPFSVLSAVSAGVKEVRDEIARAENDRMFSPNGRMLFIDEIHRFNKTQQDALLGAVERGSLTLVGATTENPSFEVNSALRSRCQLFVLQPLTQDNLRQLGERALATDPSLKALNIASVDWDALTPMSAGDARRFLNLLESLALAAQHEGRTELSAEWIAEMAPRTAVNYDRAGDMHYDMASALIKSIRGSDPQGAVYWLARMIAGGEKPEFIARRLLISAAEDIGLAHPNALSLANACAQAVERLGFPEARIPLSECAIYLACCPKSNSAYLAIDAALADVQRTGDLPVPFHLRNAPTADLKKLGFGVEYQYPHDHPGNFVAQDYLPEALSGLKWYRPGSNASEAKILHFLAERWDGAKE
ncbi:MAG: replication-associated recombination protein A [Schleiferiaceae bacterium]|jgi:putative ATPase